MVSAGTNARPQIAGLMLFPGCHWLIQKAMSYVKLSLFKTKTFMNQRFGMRWGVLMLALKRADVDFE